MSVAACGSPASPSERNEAANPGSRDLGVDFSQRVGGRGLTGQRRLKAVRTTARRVFIKPVFGRAESNANVVKGQVHTRRPQAPETGTLAEARAEGDGR